MEVDKVFGCVYEDINWVISSNFNCISDFSCFKVWILGKVLFYRWMEICYPIHYEHNSSIQSKHKWRNSYWGWVWQWFADICWFCPCIKLNCCDEGTLLKLCAGINVFEERCLDWDKDAALCKLWTLWTLVYFLERKFIDSIWILL